MKKKLLIGGFLSLVFIYFIFQKTDIGPFVEAIKRADYIYIIPVAAFSIVGFLFRALRWQCFLHPLKPLPFSKVWSATAIGYMAINVLPMRLGELVRPYAIGVLGGISKSSALATIVVERVLDMVFLMIFFAIVLFIVELPPWFVQGSYAILVIIAVALAFLLFLFIQEKRAVAFVRYILRWFPDSVADKAAAILESFIRGLHAFRENRQYIRIILFSVFMWLGYMLSVYYGFYAFGFMEKYGLNLFSALVIIVFTSVGLMIPAGPAGVGTFHAFCQEGMAFMGVTMGEGLGYAILIHTVSFAVIAVLGIYYLWKENLKLMDLQGASSTLENEEPR